MQLISNDGFLRPIVTSIYDALPGISSAVSILSLPRFQLAKKQQSFASGTPPGKLRGGETALHEHADCQRTHKLGELNFSGGPERRGGPEKEGLRLTRRGELLRGCFNRERTIEHSASDSVDDDQLEAHALAQLHPSLRKINCRHLLNDTSHVSSGSEEALWESYLGTQYTWKLSQIYFIYTHPSYISCCNTWFSKGILVVHSNATKSLETWGLSFFGADLQPVRGDSSFSLRAIHWHG